MLRCKATSILQHSHHQSQQIILHIKNRYVLLNRDQLLHTAPSIKNGKAKGIAALCVSTLIFHINAKALFMKPVATTWKKRVALES